MKDKEYIDGICCLYCGKYESNECPIKTASPWSKYDYCNQFRDNMLNQSIPEIIKGENK